MDSPKPAPALPDRLVKDGWWLADRAPPRPAAVILPFPVDRTLRDGRGARPPQDASRR